jgi:hypothetical protein
MAVGGLVCFASGIVVAGSVVAPMSCCKVSDLDQVLRGYKVSALGTGAVDPGEIDASPGVASFEVVDVADRLLAFELAAGAARFGCGDGHGDLVTLQVISCGSRCNNVMRPRR